MLIDMGLSVSDQATIVISAAPTTAARRASMGSNSSWCITGCATAAAPAAAAPAPVGGFLSPSVPTSLGARHRWGKSLARFLCGSSPLLRGP